MKQSELRRFLNHIERDQDKITTELNAQISIEQQEHRAEQDRRIEAENSLHSVTIRVKKLETDLASAKTQSDALLSAARALLPKIRVNIYTNSTQSTPRWFKTGKWWSRETGGLDADFVATLTNDELTEAMEFYGTTELPIVLPKSHRQEIEEATEL
jgi:hypothetical protein